MVPTTTASPAALARGLSLQRLRRLRRLTREKLQRDQAQLTLSPGVPPGPALASADAASSAAGDLNGTVPGAVAPTTGAPAPTTRALTTTTVAAATDGQRYSDGVLTMRARWGEDGWIDHDEAGP